MRFKPFTQAYFLIKNNPSYAKSLGDRGQNVTFWACLAAIVVFHSVNPRIPASDKI